MSVIPLESNPDVLNQFLLSLGVPDIWTVTDVYGLDDDILATVQRPVLSLILLFPTSQKYEEHCLKEDIDLKEKCTNEHSNVYYMKQYLHNACGTVALIHSIANNTHNIQLNDGCLKQFINNSLELTPDERGKLLQADEGIIRAHKAVAKEGQTNPPTGDEEVDFHFIAFVCKDGQLYELDGERLFPIPHGPSTPETLLEDAVKIVKEFIARDPNNLNFTLLALTPSCN